jgi:hypothetical protein
MNEEQKPAGEGQKIDEFGLCMTKAELQALPVEKQRVEIARDVLRMMKGRQLEAEHAVYVGLGFSLTDIIERNPRARLADIFQSKRDEGGRIGSVCAIGAAFVSAVDKFGRLKASDTEDYLTPDGSPDEMIKYLGRWFSREQLRLMELAFEGKWWGVDIEAPEQRLFHRAQKFCERLSAEAGMEKIMRNVVKNNGTFKP